MIIIMIIPFPRKKVVIKDEWLSPYCTKIKEKFNLASDKTTKLIPTSFNKEKYVLHIKNLESYLKLGMRLTKIYRVLQFNESSWLEPYIYFNTKKRAESKSEFGKKKKLLYGKTLENLRNRINVRLVNNEDVFTKHAAKANFISGKMFNGNLFAINRIKEQLLLNRPIYVGMTVLDFSKYLMFDFHYNYMLNKYDKEIIK